MNRLIADMEDLIRRTVGPAIRIEVVRAGGLWPTLVDRNQLENALLNLCINARDAMPEGGRITIETANTWLDVRAAQERDLPPGQYVSLSVTDTGTGMTPDVIARAFDPFFTTKPLGEGTGLGLSMIYGFVRQSGGQVRIYSEVGHGTTMCIYLPRDYERRRPTPASPTCCERAQRRRRGRAGGRRRADGAHADHRGAGAKPAMPRSRPRMGRRAEGAAVVRPDRSADHRCRAAGWHQWPAGRRRGAPAAAGPEDPVHHRLCGERWSSPTAICRRACRC